MAEPEQRVAKIETEQNAAVSRVVYPGHAADVLLEIARKEQADGALVSMKNDYDGTRWWLEICVLRKS